MKKVFLLMAIATTLLVNACTKKSNDPAPDQNTPIAEADANGLIESFSFDGNSNGSRRGTGITVTNTNATYTGTDRGGNANRALIIPANGSLEIAGLPLPSGNSSRSISFWVQTNSLDSKTFIAYGASNNEFRIAQFYAVTGMPPTLQRSIFVDGGFNFSAISNNSSITAGSGGCAWVHFIATYDSTTKTLVLYRDGTKIAESTNSAGINTATGTSLRIGGTGACTIDDVMIYNRVLNGTEIQTLTNAGRPTTC